MTGTSFALRGFSVEIRALGFHQPAATWETLSIMSKTFAFQTKILSVWQMQAWFGLILTLIPAGSTLLFPWLDIMLQLPAKAYISPLWELYMQNHSPGFFSFVWTHFSYTASIHYVLSTLSYSRNWGLFQLSLDIWCTVCLLRWTVNHRARAKQKRETTMYAHNHPYILLRITIQSNMHVFLTCGRKPECLK